MRLNKRPEGSDYWLYQGTEGVKSVPGLISQIHNNSFTNIW